MFFLLIFQIGLALGDLRQACYSDYYDSLDYEQRCVACGIQKAHPAKVLPSPGWLTLLSLASQKYLIQDDSRDGLQKKKALIQMLTAYGVCFSPGYRVRNSPRFWERVTAGAKPISSIDSQENDFWNSFGIRLDSASMGGLFGCDEEKGCESGFEYFFKVDHAEWAKQSPRQRQKRFLKAVSQRFTADVNVQGELSSCLNQVSEQFDEVIAGINGALNFRDLSSAAPNPLNVRLCQSMAETCGLDANFCVEDWNQGKLKNNASQRKSAVVE